jgi:hypothetical protein
MPSPLRIMLRTQAVEMEVIAADSLLIAVYIISVLFVLFLLAMCIWIDLQVLKI